MAPHNTASLGDAHQQITSLFRQYAEWLYVVADDRLDRCGAKRSIAISHRRRALMLDREGNSMVAACMRGNGPGSRCVAGVTQNGPELSIIELIPRVSARAIAATIKAAREIRCDRWHSSLVRCNQQLDRHAHSAEERDPAILVATRKFCSNVRLNGSRSLVRWFRVTLQVSMLFFRRRYCGSGVRRTGLSRHMCSSSG